MSNFYNNDKQEMHEVEFSTHSCKYHGYKYFILLKVHIEWSFEGNGTREVELLAQ